MIKGVSDVRQIPRIGKIRLGVQKVSGRTGNDYPEAVDYFVCVPDQSTPEWAAKAFHEVYGDKPKMLDVMFPLNDTEKFFPQWYRRYGKGTGLICMGDGEKIIKSTEPNNGICNPDNCQWYHQKLCRHIGTIQFLLPQVRGLGIWQIDTTSFHSIVNLNSGIDFVKGFTGGRIAWLPLKLSVQPKEVQPDGKKKTAYVMAIDNEQVKMEDIIKASMLKPIHLLIPDLNMDEAPDDLFPASVISPDPAPPAPAEPPLKTEEEPKPGVSEKIAKIHIQTAYQLIRESGATDEMAKIINEHEFTAYLTPDNKINWTEFPMPEYIRLCELYSSGKWKAIYQNIMEMESIADSLPSIHDIEIPSLTIGGAKL